MKKKINYRHYICISITLVFLACIMLFPYAFGRLLESIRDLLLSLLYYFCELFEADLKIPPTVCFPTAMPFTLPFNLPSSWEEFKTAWSAYWKLFVSEENILEYLKFLTDKLYIICQLLLLVIPLLFVVYLLFDKYLNTENTDYNKQSDGIAIWHKFSTKILLPVKLWIKEFILFIKKKRVYWIIWLCLWAFYFNIFSILIEFFAYYFYFVIAFDLLSLFMQAYKLLMDLSVMIDFLPLVVWLIAGYIVFDKVRKNIALKIQQHCERKNCGFINERPIVYMVCGTMGKKKTTLMTDMALSQEAMFRDKAFEMILENDLKFPFFPWINLENAIKRAIEKHQVYNLATSRKFIRHLRFCFETVQTSDKTLKACIRRHLKKTYRLDYRNFLFDYDIDKHGYYYDDGLKTVDVWEVLETYTQLYVIYTVQSSLIISNYSVRTDNLLDDIGNFPLWNNDFFSRNSKYIDSYSRHSHILDFDSVRLGKKLVENNVFADSFEFGIVLVTEVGKERKNMLELQGIKKVELTANQKNDGFNDWLKMVRHSATVDYFPFVKVITDEQRPDSWGSDARQLCEIVHIEETSETKLAIPCFSLEILLHDYVFSKFTDMYYRYRYNRSDETLPMYFLKWFTSKSHGYYKKIFNRYGYCSLLLNVEKGTQDGEKKNKEYYLSTKKIYSKRFSTDCFSDFFSAKALRSPVGLEDVPVYQTEKATLEELKQQNSYFVNDLLLGMTEEKNTKE